MRPDTITLAIFEKYTPEEMRETADKLVQALTEKETAETEKKASDAVFKERINTHEAEAIALATRYTKGGEAAQIGCDIRYDVPEVGKKSYIRMDTGEAVEVHEMNWEEKQETIQFPLAPSPEQVDQALTKISEEVTRVCPYPGCIDFADHEGEHRFPKVEPATKADSAVTPDPQREPERKPRKRKPHAPPPEPPCQEPPSPGAGD